MTAADETGFRSLFDGETLAGWHSAPRIYGTSYPDGPAVHSTFERIGRPLPIAPELHPARWFVTDGAIVGEQSAPGSGYGGYLVSDEKFGDFELRLEMKPDWPADTGVMIRRQRDSWEGFQVLVDHRDAGGIGGFFGNGLGAFHALPFGIRAQLDQDGKPVGLMADDPATSKEPVTENKRRLLRHAARVEDFLDVWRWEDWNTLRIRAVGALPVITTWINDLKIAEIDTASKLAPNYDPAAVLDLLGPQGHLALEVHDSDPRDPEWRWGQYSQCRWRNIRIRDLPDDC